MNETDKAIAAYDEWKLSKGSGGVEQLTHVQVANRYNICSKSVQRTRLVMESASEFIQRIVREGFARVGKTFNVVKQAEKETGIVINESTPEKVKQKVFAVQERIFYERMNKTEHKKFTDYHEKLKTEFRK
jgi:hypothetical protein